MHNQTVEAYCLKVPKACGEKAVRLAAEIGILNRGLKVQSDDSYLYVPLDREPLPAHVAEFEKRLPYFDVLVQGFIGCVKRAQKLSEIVAEFLPPHLLASFPRSIDFVGDIAIVEIPPELEACKKPIGEAILKAHKHMRTVLAKLGAVTGVYRLREFEVIAGAPNTETTHREHGCKYRLDVSKAYFSPRLSNEHLRVASKVGENETVIDMFAGVGPFSILIAKMHRNVTVYAIDINPQAIEYLEKNVALNRVQEKVVPILGDAEKVIRERLRGKANRVIMNLPEKANEYLASACEAVKAEGGTIHYYEFAEGPDLLEAAKNRLTERINRTRREVEGSPSARLVREVAPFKWQIAIDAEIR
jgi:tRNA (guanine37-N1)-methyltransferase